MKMDLREILVFTMLWNMSYSLHCYKCTPEMIDYRDNLCEHFDYSDKYVANCADSTMCYKKEITSSLGNGLKIYERDCARQILSGDQVRTNTGWDRVKRIYEVHKEGCKQNSMDDDKITKALHCYCRGDLCNGAGVLKRGALMLVIVILSFLMF